MVREGYNNIVTDCLLNLHCCLSYFNAHAARDTFVHLGNAYDSPILAFNITAIGMCAIPHFLATYVHIFLIS